jgi:hypothetical protein
MSWSPTLYLQFADAGEARALAVAIGAPLDADGNPAASGESYALVVPITEWISRPTLTDAGEKRSGTWAMMRFNLDTAEGVAAYALVQASGAVEALAEPGNVFA